MSWLLSTLELFSTFPFSSRTAFLMYKDPVCNMMVDENKTQYISQVGDWDVYLMTDVLKNGIAAGKELLSSMHH